MKRIYSDINPDLLLVAIQRKNEITEDRSNISPESEFLQASSKNLHLGTSFAPHKHKSLLRESNITQEAWVFLSGKVAAQFWDIDDRIIYETTLSGGDCAVVFRGGHSFQVLEDNTILYEFKLGPYFGQDKDKEFLER